ncbi:protein translocase subunit SecD [Peredibacter starrii]|uniref:Protein translocase subunit SecD n=1 Tax=Peredibacter starrii TaxID=28202 RepID=A0AAX4HKZ5_9BACT|nr:protein translocase subunit SecD [Peredibacter starrii]WPU63891.1 protein translocase subunit SecD [Peredibacter starrii]
MAKGWWFRFSFLAALVIGALMAVTPTFLNLKDDSSFPVKSKINLGLDLQGGLYMVLGIDFNKVYRDEVTGYARKTIATLKDIGIEATLGTLNTSDAKDPKHSIVIAKESDLEAARAKLKEFYAYPLRLTAEEGTTLTYGLGREFTKEIEDTALSKSIEVIRNRIDEFGVTEPEIVSQGSDRIVVQLPGVKDINRAKDLIGKTAKLEFKFVNDNIAPTALNEWLEKVKKAGIEYKKGERFSDYVRQINDTLRADLPAGNEIAFAKTVNKVTNDITNLEPYLVESTASLTGEELQEAVVRIDQQQNRPYVGLEFKPNGAKIFENITGANIGKRLAIVLDGNVYSAPVVQGRIAGGSAQITLGAGDYNATMTEARDLALVLRAGALPVELVFEEQRVVGPSLGADAIDKAQVAAAIGSLLVLAFMCFYYKLSGLIATVTIVLNVLFTIAILIGVGATLSLPGIAGIALTVGMAVDGNILIYERIREELAIGLTPFEAVRVGFEKAFWAIADANITTALAGICLLNFGTGPVRGFAVTLLIGICTTVYTSYFVSKVLFEMYVGNGERKKLSI